MSNSNIADFYIGQSVFLTGGTGFLGKVLIEKLLRSCPGIEKIYMLIRPKKDKSPNDRLMEIVDSPAFDYIRETSPSSLSKLVMVEGDVSELGLGLSEVNRKVLCDNVTIVLNAAASISFGESLKKAVFTNLRSMREIVELAHGMKKIKAFVHSSTAFVNITEEHQKEELYPIDLDPEFVIAMCEKLPDEILNQLEPILLGKKINTYFLTKHLSEILLSNKKKNLPVTIVRPSAIGSSISEPMPGWIDAYSAAAPFVDMSSRGAFCSYCEIKDSVFDVIPMDMVVNAMIAASWNVANNPQNDIKIYNISSGDENPLKMKYGAQQMAARGRLCPSDLIIWYPQMRVYNSKTAHKIDNFLTHYVPAVLMDVIRRLRGKKLKYVKIYNFIEDIMQRISFVNNIYYRFKTENSQKLFKSLTQNDQKEFNFDPKMINWNEYIVLFHLGLRKYLTKDKTLNSKEAFKKLNRLKLLNYGLKAAILGILLFVIGTVVYKIVSSIF